MFALAEREFRGRKQWQSCSVHCTLTELTQQEICTMDNHTLEQRVAQLEKQVASLQGIYATHLRMDALRVVGLEIKVESLEARLKDLDKIEKLVFDAYVQTHPEAQETILQIDRTVDMGVQHLYFENLPSIKDARSKRSKS
jgi:hypothetical protein